MHVDDAYKCMVIVGVVRCVIGIVPCICNDGIYCGLHGYAFSWRVEMHGDVLEEFLKRLSSIPECAFVHSF